MSNADALLGDLRLRLKQLYRDQGEPSYRELEKRCSKEISHTTIYNIVKCTTCPKWESLKIVVTTLGGSVDEFRTLWVALREAEQPIQHQVVPSSSDMHSAEADGVQAQLDAPGLQGQGDVEPAAEESVGPSGDELTATKNRLERTEAKLRRANETVGTLQARVEALEAQLATRNAEETVEKSGADRLPSKPSGWSVFRRTLLPPLVGVASVLVIWWLTATAIDSRALYPAPPDIAKGVVENFFLLIDQAGITVRNAVSGFAVGATAGLIVAQLLAIARSVGNALWPVFLMINSIPTVSIFPLLVLGLGVGSGAKVALVSLMSFFPVMTATYAGVRSTPSEFTELSRSYGASRWGDYAKIRIPYAVPYIFIGLKVAVPLAMVGAIVAEFTTRSAGLGSVIMRATELKSDTSVAFAAIVLLGLANAVLFYGVVAAERLLVPWERATSSPRY